MKTHREFRKHRITREVVAVELYEGAIVGVRVCERPEEQTRGALPVMEIQAGSRDLEEYERNAGDYDAFEPATLPADLLADLSTADDAIAVCEDAYELKRTEAKAAKEALDLALAHMRGLVKKAKAAQAQPALQFGEQ